MFAQCNVTLMVADMNRAVDFYSRALQLPLSARYGDEWAQIEAPGLTIGLHPRREPEAAAAATGHISLGFQVNDLSAAIAQLRERGVAIDESAVSEGGNDRIVNFSDPDGTPLYLIQMNW